MRRVREHLPSPAMVVALAALVVALGGTAFAVSKINGRLIAKHSVPGDRLVAHTLGAGQINKKSLGKVLAAGQADSATTARSATTAGSAATAASAANAANANALGGIGASGFLAAGATAVDSAKLGGIAPGGFVEGRGHSYFGVADAPVSPATSDCGESVNRTRVLEVPGWGFLDGYCSNYNAGTPICTYSFHNTSPGAFSGAREASVGGEGITTATNLEHVATAPGSAILGGTNANIAMERWQLSEGSPARQLDAFVTMSHPQASPSACHLMAEVEVLGE